MAHQPHGLQVQERRACGGSRTQSAALAGGGVRRPAGRSRRRAKYSRPARLPKFAAIQPLGGLGADADAVVLADEQQRQRKPLVGGVDGGVDRADRGGVVRRRIAEAADAMRRRATGRATPSLAARPMEKATPTARGRWEAIVEVCGMTLRSWRPNTLCRPPEIGSSVAATIPSSTSRSGSLPCDLPGALEEEATRAVVQQRGVGRAQGARRRRRCPRGPRSRSCRTPCRASAASARRDRGAGCRAGHRRVRGLAARTGSIPPRRVRRGPVLFRDRCVGHRGDGGGEVFIDLFGHESGS